jgi:hypothetical protein
VVRKRLAAKVIYQAQLEAPLVYRESTLRRAVARVVHPGRVHRRRWVPVRIVVEATATSPTRAKGRT